MSDHTSALLPFRGLRFRPDVPGGLASTIGPPYDFDTSDEARDFAANLPNCAVRLEVEDSSNPLAFTKARALLNDWLHAGVLAQDESPVYYVYEQHFEQDGAMVIRRAVFGLVPLDAADVFILPHEETWEENRERRVQLLRELETAPSPVYLIYDSGQQSPASFLASLTSRPPDSSATDVTGNQHHLWIVANPDDIERLATVMQGQHFVIADGHHRYAAAVQYHEEHQRPDTAVVLACCVDAHDPGIVIRPIHRLLRSRDTLDLAAALGTLDAWFDITTSPVGDRTGRNLSQELTAGDLPEAGLISNGGLTFTHLRLRDWTRVDSLLPGDQTEPANQLDVTAITELVMRRALQLDPAATGALDYFDDPEDILALTRQGEGLGLLMRPIRLSQVFAVARSGGTVPPKSTSFVPKIPVGLVMHELPGSGRGTRDAGRGEGHQ